MCKAIYPICREREFFVKNINSKSCPQKIARPRRPELHVKQNSARENDAKKPTSSAGLSLRAAIICRYEIGAGRNNLQVWNLSSDLKFYRNVATTGGQAISHVWTSDGVVCWLVTCRLVYASSVKITYLVMTQCPRAFRQYICSAHDQLIQVSLDLPNYDSREFRSCYVCRRLCNSRSILFTI